MTLKRLTPIAIGAAFAMALGLGATAAQAEKKISVLTWNIPYFQEGFNKWVEAYKKIHPDVTVEWLDKKGTEWSTFYQTQVVAGTPPDIIDVQGGLWLEYASQGGLVDLTPYLAKDKEYTDRIYPEFLKNWVFEGKNYGVPLYVTKSLLFYNKLMFKEAGLSEPPATFDQLMDYAAKMTKGEKSGFMTLNFDWLYWPLFAANGIDLLTPDLKKAAFNTPKAVALVERLAKATKDGVINKISWTGRWVEPNGAFAAGTVGMLNAHAPAFLWFKSKGPWVDETTVGATQFPGGWSTPNSHALLISKGTKYPQEAWDFVKMATSGDGAYVFGTGSNNLSGDRITNEKLLAYFSQQIPAVVPALKTQLAELDKLTGNWPIAKDAQVKEAFYPELQAALLGDKSAKEALDEAEKKVNRVLSRR
ncbi:MAG: sugar ABC transporter substrate-binding protein [Rhodospirillales bacterium]|jgi:ABC-type glycerol-3-phosphate transport system substrate-binding protein|nr:sugar ABC transporter substrate-binding protein [Rhodospirillales bacterium]